MLNITGISSESNGSESKEEKLDAIWEAHVQQLIPCQNCGRTFFPDRIVVHQKSCKGKVTPSSGGGSFKKSLQKPKNLINKNLEVANNSPEVMMMLSSPQPVRRQLHSQQDAVVVVHSQDKLSRLKSLGNSQERE